VIPSGYLGKIIKKRGWAFHVSKSFTICRGQIPLDVMPSKYTDKILTWARGALQANICQGRKQQCPPFPSTSRANV